MNCAEWVWRTDDGRTTLLCGAGHAGPRPFMTIRSPALHPIKRCVIKAFGLATNQYYFGAAGESLLRGKSEGSLSGFCTSLARPTATEAIRSAGWPRRYWVAALKACVSPYAGEERQTCLRPRDSGHEPRWLQPHTAPRHSECIPRKPSRTRGRPRHHSGHVSFSPRFL